MLVFTRTLGESFRIGDDVEILVADTNGVVVKLGVNAPKEIPVHREEIYRQIEHASERSGLGFSLPLKGIA